MCRWLQGFYRFHWNQRRWNDLRGDGRLDYGPFHLLDRRRR